MVFTKLSELPVIDSMDCGVNDEFMDSSGFGGGGVGVDLRGEAPDADGRRSPGFGETGRANGSSLDVVAIEDTLLAAPVGVWAGGAGSLIGGGGIIPLL